MNSDQGLVEGIDYYTTSDSSTGAVAGYVKDDYIEDGQQSSTKALQDFYKYVVLTGSGLTIHAVSAETVYSAATTATGDTSGRTTSFVYQNNSVPITKVTETLPSTGTGQNLLPGSGYTGTVVTTFYANGQEINAASPMRTASQLRYTYIVFSLTGNRNYAIVP